MKNPASPRNNSKKGFSNSKPPAEDKLDSRGDLEINEQPSGNNKKELKIGEKNEYNDPQGASQRFITFQLSCNVKNKPDQYRSGL